MEQKLQQNNLFIQAHQSYRAELKRHSFFMVHNHALAEDLVQDAFIKTWNYIYKGGKIDMMKAFLYRVLNCLIIDEYRRKKAISLDILVENGFEPTKDYSEQLIDEIDGKATILIIDRLPQKYRTVILMRYVQNLTIKEISATTKLSKNAVAVQIHRGLAQLKLLVLSSHLPSHRSHSM